MRKFMAYKAFWSGYDDRWFEPGDWCLIENNNALKEDDKPGLVGLLYEQVGSMEDFSLLEFGPMLDWDKLKSGDRVLVHRVGAVGDLVQAAPLCYELAERGVTIVFVCEDSFDIALPIMGAYSEGVQFERRRRRDYGITPVEVDWVVNLESTIEASHDATPILDLYLQRTKNPPDLLCDPKQRMPGGKYFQKAQQVIREYLFGYEGGEFYDVLISPKAGAAIRSIPALQHLPGSFFAEHDCAIVGIREVAPVYPCPVLPRLEPKQLYYLMANAMLFVGCDSGLAHLAYWMGTPLVAFYNLVDWRARLYPADHTCIVDLTMLCPMAPCWWHNAYCPLLSSDNSQVDKCAATLYLDENAVAQLLEARFRAGSSGHLLVNGTELAGVPDYVRSKKGLRNAQGGPYIPHA